jgi:hypothetical protein
VIPGRKAAAPKAAKVTVVTNKNSGRGTPRAGLGKVIGSILATPYRHYDTATLRELDGAVEAIGNDRPDIVAWAGGDGSVHHMVTRLVHKYADIGAPLPRLLYIPTGTMNNLAHSIDLTRMPAVDFAKMIAAKLEAQRRGANLPFQTAALDPIRVNGDKYCFLYGAGLPVNILHEYEKVGYRCENRDACGFVCTWAVGTQLKGECPMCGHKVAKEGLGPWRAIKVILAAFWSRRLRKSLTRPVHARIALPEGNDPPVAPFMTHTGIIVATVDQLGMGMRGMPDAMSRPGHFMLRSTQLTFWGLTLPTTLGALWSGLPLPKSFDAVVPRLTIEYEEPTVTTLDGEIMAPTFRDTLECGPRISFITG